MRPSGQTRCCGIIGDPVAHTLSPAMHDAAFRALGLDYVYLAFRVDKGSLGRAIRGMKALGIRGLNVTMPHKTAVMRYLDEVDDKARRVGAVNTIVNEGGRLTGYNTDAPGFLRALAEAGVEPQGKKAVVLGAGGAARAVSFALAGEGADLTVLGRHPGRARALAVRVGRFTGTRLAALELNPENIVAALGGADILVNATPIGQSPDIDRTPVAPELLRPGLIVFDAVYEPARTRLLGEAETAGARVIGGREMLLGQGAIAFEMWTGRPAPIEVMRAALTSGAPDG